MTIPTKTKGFAKSAGHFSHLVIFILISFFILGILAAHMVTSYRSLDRQIRDTSSNEAAIFANWMDATLRRLQADIEWFGTASVHAHQDLGAELAILAGAFPEIMGFEYYSPGGQLLFNSSAEMDNFCDRESIVDIILQDPSTQLTFSETLWCEQTQNHILVAYQEIRHADKQVHGILAARIDLNFFKAQFARLSLGERGMASIRHSQTSQLVVRWPDLKGRMNNAAPNIPPQILINQGINRGVTRYVGATDGVERIFAFQKIAGYPFYVLIGREIHEQFSRWYADAAIALIIGLGIITASGILLRRLRLNRNELQQSRLRYIAIVENQTDAVCRWTLQHEISYANSRFIAMFGTTLTSGSAIKSLLELVQQQINPASQTHVTIMPMTDQAGEQHYMEWVSLLIPGPEDQPGEYQSVGRDISGRIQAESKLLESLELKEKLIQELFHRTRNNMQVVLALVAAQLAGNESTAARPALLQLEDRVSTIVLAQQLLDASTGLSRIPLQAYIKRLHDLVRKRDSNKAAHCGLNIGGDDLDLLIDLASPLGLVMNELMAATISYNLHRQHNCSIDIQIRLLDAEQLHIEYNSSPGGPLPEQSGTDPDTERRADIEMIKILVEHQLGGTLSLTAGPNLHCALSFPINAYRERVSM